MLSTYIFSILSFITFFVGAITYSKYKNTFLKYFLYFLLFEFLTELTSYYLGVILRKSTFFLFNIYVLISSIFYLMLFRFYIKKHKIYINIMIIIYIIFYVCNVLFLQKTLQIFQSYSLILESIFIVLSSVILFIELLNSDDILKMNKLLLFWISIGLLLFYVGILPIIIMSSFLEYRGLFDYIILLLNIIMYGCFITGFLVSKKEYNI